MILMIREKKKEKKKRKKEKKKRKKLFQPDTDRSTISIQT